VLRSLLLVLTVVVTTVVSSSTAVAARAPAHTKARAEINVLHAVMRLWTAKRIPTLINRRTRLLANNTQAICRGRGKRQTGQRYSRFVCVIQPRKHRLREGLYVDYRALRKGRCRIHWLYYRR
jgi:hypothetical protein